MNEEDQLVEERDFAFDVNRESMLRKIRKYLLSDPMDYVREFVQMGILTGSESIHINNSAFSFTMEDNGRGISQSDIETLLSRLFVGGNEGDAHDGFAMGVISALEAGADEIEIESLKNGVPVHFIMDGNYNMQFSEGKRKKPGTKVTVKRHNLMNYLKSRKVSAKERVKVQEYCKFMPIDFQFNGRQVHKNKGLENVIVQVEKNYGDSRVMLGLPSGDTDDTIAEILRGGIYYTDKQIWGLDSTPLKARVDYEKFKLNLSRNAIVFNNKDSKLIKVVLEKLLENLTLEVCKAYNTLRNDDRKRANNYLFHQLAREPNHQRVLDGQLTFDTEVQEALANLPLFRTVTRKEISLVDICQFTDAEQRIIYISPEEMKERNLFRYNPLRKAENLDELVLANYREKDILRHIFNLREYRAPVPKQKIKPPNPWPKPTGPSKLDQLVEQFEEKKNEQRKRFEEQLIRARSPFKKAYRSIADYVNAKREAIGNSLDAFFMGIDNKVVKPVENGIKNSALAVYNGVLIIGGIAISPLVYIAKGLNKGTQYTGRKLDEASQKREEVKQQHKIKKRRTELRREAEQRKIEEKLEHLRIQEKARRATFFREKVSQLFQDHGSEELREMFSLESKVEAVKDEPEWNESEEAFTFLRTPERYSERYRLGKDEEEKPSLLVFNENHPFTETIVQEMQDENAEHVLMPTIYHQLFMAQRKNRNYTTNSKRDYPVDVYTAVLTRTQENQMDELLADSSHEFIKWYENDQEKPFKKHYKVLDDDVRRQVLVGVFASDHSNATMDEYLSRTDPDLVHEIGSTRVEQVTEDNQIIGDGGYA